MKKLFFALLATVAAMAAAPVFAQNAMPSPTGARAPGLYVQVLDGLIHVTNPAGTSNFSAGQFGYTSSFRQPPVLLPVNPGIPFTLPSGFSPVSSTPVVASNSAPPKPNTVDCEVR